MADSDSSLSSAPPTDDEIDVEMPEATAKKPLPQKKKKKKNTTILSFFKHRSPSPPPRKRAPSPPHEAVPEDNPDIAVRIGRVHRVVTRCVVSQSRKASPLSIANTFRIVHRHVPVALQRSFPTRLAFHRASGHRARCRRGHAVHHGGRAAVLLARTGPQSQEACRVSRPLSPFMDTCSMVA
jgi:hypothetical protein